MEYGSYFGDGAQRGPDFTADALHQISQSMVKFYLDELKMSKVKGLTSMMLVKLKKE